MLFRSNRTAGPERPLLADGAKAAADPAEAVAGAEFICLCLSDDAAVRAVLAAATPALCPGALVIDFSTIAPATSVAVAAELAERGCRYLDAPVTGGTEGARNGSLAILVGGREDDLARARPLLELLGNRISHFGPVGQIGRAHV